MSIISQEIEIFLEMQGRRDLWDRWTAAKQKYVNERDLALKIFASLLDETYLASILPNLPYENPDDLKRYCRETASRQHLSELFEAVNSPRNEWYELKASDVVRKALRDALGLAKSLSLHRVHMNAKKLSEQDAFILVTGGPRFFIDHSGHLRPLTKPHEYLEVLRDVFANLSDADEIPANYSTELDFLDRSLVQAQGTSRAARQKTVGEYVSDVKQRVASLEPEYVSSLYPEFPAGDVKALIAFCKNQATEEELKWLFKVCTDRYDLWRTEKATPEIRSFVSEILTKAEVIANNRGGRVAEGEHSDVFVFLIGGVRFYKDLYWKARSLTSLEDFIEYLEFLDKLANIEVADLEMELRFLVDELGLSADFVDVDFSDSRKLKFRARTLLARQDVNYRNSLLPRFPSDNLDDFKAFCAGPATEEDLAQLFEVCVDPSEVWRTEKASGDIRRYIDDCLQGVLEITGKVHDQAVSGDEATFWSMYYADNGQRMKSTMSNRAFVYLLGGLRFYRDANGHRVELHADQPELLAEHLFRYREYFRAAEKRGATRELRFLCESHDLGASDVSQVAFAMRTHIVENIYNMLLGRERDLQDYLEFSSTSGSKLSRYDFNEAFGLDLGPILFLEAGSEATGCLSQTMPIEIQVSAVEKPGMPLIYFEDDKLKTRVSTILARSEKISSILISVNGQYITIPIKYEPVWIEAGILAIDMGVIYQPGDLAKQYSVRIPFRSAGLTTSEIGFRGDLISAAVVQQVSDDQILLNISLNVDKQIDQPGLRNAKSKIEITGMLGTSKVFAPVILRFQKDFPIIVVKETEEGKFVCATDNGRPATLQVMLNDDKNEIEVSGKQFVYRVPKRKISSIRFMQNGEKLLEKDQIYEVYFREARRRRRTRRLLGAICLLGTVLLLRTHSAFTYLISQKLRPLTDIVLIANTGVATEHLMEMLNDASADHFAVYDIISQKGIDSPELANHLSLLVTAGPTPSIEVAAVLGTLQKMSQRAPYGTDLDTSPALRVIGGKVWLKCVYGNKGTSCGTHEPLFANWQTARQHCGTLRVTKPSGQLINLFWSLPGVDAYAEALKKSSPFDNSGLATADWLHWTNSLIAGTTKVLVVAINEKSVFQAPMTNEYTFRCVGEIKQ